MLSYTRVLKRQTKKGFRPEKSYGNQRHFFNIDNAKSINLYNENNLQYSTLCNAYFPHEHYKIVLLRVGISSTNNRFHKTRKERVFGVNSSPFIKLRIHKRIDIYKFYLCLKKYLSINGICLFQNLIIIFQNLNIFIRIAFFNSQFHFRLLCQKIIVGDNLEGMKRCHERESNLDYYVKGKDSETGTGISQFSLQKKMKYFSV